MSNTEAVHNAYRHTPISPVDATNLRNLTASITSELDRIDTDIEDVRKQKHISTATGESLEQLVELFPINRKDGESVAHFRQRIRLRGHATRSGGTTDQLIELSAVALETTIDSVTAVLNSGGELEIEVSPDIIDSAVLSEGDIEDLCTLSVPAGHRYQLAPVSQGTLAISGTYSEDETTVVRCT